jgi:hypothetical protein
VLRRTIPAVSAALAALAVAVAAGGAPNRAAADPFIGEWTIVPKAGTPWANGGTLTVSAASKSEVMGLGPVCDGCGLDRPDGQPVPFGNNGYESQCIGHDPAIWPPGSGTDPTVSAWYVLTFSWPSPKMGGCISNKTSGSIAYFGNPREFRGYVAARPGGTIFGAYVKDPGSTGFEGKRAAEGTTKTVNEPAPGKSTFIEPCRPLPRPRRAH